MNNLEGLRIHFNDLEVDDQGFDEVGWAIEEIERLEKEISDQSTEIQMHWFSPLEGKGMKQEIERLREVEETLSLRSEGQLAQIERLKAAAVYDAGDRSTTARGWAIIALEAEARAEYLESALLEVSEGKGRFSINPMAHAENTVEDMKKIALGAILGTWEADDE